MNRPAPSIRGNLTRTLLAGLLVLSCTTAVVTYAVARGAILRQFDIALLARARALATLLHWEDSEGYEFDLADGVTPEFERNYFPDYFQIWLPDGAVIVRARRLGSRDLPLLAGEADKPRFMDLRHPGGGRLRAVGLSFVPQVELEPGRTPRPSLPPPDLPATVVVAQSVKPLENLLTILLAVAAAGGLLVPAGGVLLVRWTVRSGLRPLDNLAEQVRGITPHNLETRLALTGVPAEVMPVGSKLNDLLARLQAVFERERRFTSDVSHELRTPLAEIRTSVEMAARWPEDRALYEQSCTAAIEATDHMRELLDRLLMLARAESGALSPQATDTDVAAVTRNLLDTFGTLAASRDLRVEMAAPESVRAATDPVLLAVILRNLVENAMVYAPAGTRVEIRIAPGPAGYEWFVRNDAPDLDPGELGEMFTPFWRKDASRTGDAHSGIGLGMVAAYSRLLGIAVDPQLDADHRLVMRLVIPPGGPSGPA